MSFWKKIFKSKQELKGEESYTDEQKRQVKAFIKEKLKDENKFARAKDYKESLNLETQLIRASGKTSEAWKGDIDEVRRLISEGANINAMYLDKTALMEASIEGHFEIAKLLLDNGADVNLVDSDFRTALMFAAQNGHKDIVIELINNGADLLKKDNQGDTALTKASRWSREEIISLLNDKIGDSFVDESRTTIRDYSTKIKRCLNCNAELTGDQMKCPDCGSNHYIWE